ncbi:MAG: calcium-binding protein, partial [Beijerinckiaceae bacterium]
TGGALNDTIIGLTGDDTLRGNAGDDSLDGGDGLDTAVFAGNRSAYTVTEDNTNGLLVVEGPEGRDVLRSINRLQFADQSIDVAVPGRLIVGTEAADSITGGEGADNLVAGSGNDTISGGQGGDTIDGGSDDDVVAGGQGADEITGGNGFDVVDASADARLGGTLGAYFDLNSGFAQDVFGAYDRLTSIEAAFGTDLIRSGALSDIFLGSAGANSFYGLGGQDYATGGDGDDFIDLGEGDQNIGLGQNGADTLTGGTGIDYLFGGDGADSLIGNGGEDFLVGGEFIAGAGPYSGFDSAFGGDGADILMIGTNGGAWGLASGGAGNDVIYGSSTTAGDDLIRGGTGSDFLFGFSGADTYRFETADLGTGDTDIVVAVNAGDRFSFSADLAEQIFLNAGNGAFDGQTVSGVYMGYSTATGLWVAWLPFQTVANVQAQSIFV